MIWFGPKLEPGERIVLLSPPAAIRRWIIGGVIGGYVVYVLFVLLAFGRPALEEKLFSYSVQLLAMLLIMGFLTRWRVAITDRQLICRGDGFRESLQRMRLDEIEAVRHDATTNLVTVRSKGGREVKFRADWTGIDAFEAALGRMAGTGA